MKTVLSSLMALSVSIPAISAQAEGEATYKAVCASCHAVGAANAPRVGDRKKWASLIREGQATLTAHGYVGIRGMPPKGGMPDLSVEAFADAVVYMANQSGATWSSPDAQLMAAIEHEISKREKALALKVKR